MTLQTHPWELPSVTQSDITDPRAAWAKHLGLNDLLEGHLIIVSEPAKSVARSVSLNFPCCSGQYPFCCYKILAAVRQPWLTIIKFNVIPRMKVHSVPHLTVAVYYLRTFTFHQTLSSTPVMHWKNRRKLWKGHHFTKPNIILLFSCDLQYKIQISFKLLYSK